MLRSLTLVALALAAALALSVTVVGAGHARPVQSQFPVTITTPTGKVTIAKRPTRIVSLSPTATETLFAIGAGPQVVAVDDQSDYPKSAPKTTLSGFTPNVEAIASYRPGPRRHLVQPPWPGRVAEPAADPGDLPRRAEGRRGRVPADPPARPRHRARGRAPPASSASMKTRIGTIVRAARGKAGRLSVYHELTPDFYSASSQIVRRKVYAALGLENIADEADSSGTGFPQLSAEYIVASSPDVIVLADSVCCGQKPSTVAARPGWERINAVRTGSIVRVHDSIASRWGPRLVSFFRAMSAALARL